MKAMKIFICLLAIVVISGCAQTIKWDQEMYTEHKTAAEQGIKTHSFNSGFFTCALGATQITFPTTIKNATELQAFIQNPTVILGIAQLDQIAKEEGKWDEHDFRLGCFQGTKTKMTVSELIAAVKLIWPQAAPFMPSLK